MSMMMKMVGIDAGVEDVQALRNHLIVCVGALLRRRGRGGVRRSGADRAVTDSTAHERPGEQGVDGCDGVQQQCQVNGHGFMDL